MSRAVFALLLVLLVPAQAAALCCLASADRPESTHARGAAHHAHRPADQARGEASGAAGEEGARLSAATASECAPLARSLPAVRERGPADDLQKVFHAPAGSSPAFWTARAAADAAIHPAAPRRAAARAEILLPLRL